ncbi:MAG: methyl-accepting chemotaxis protein [Oscillospiraceae bacterium]|nr:methyl-accepting chemotaxis protein [Oscillospiraceae bacterium]
MKNLTIRNKVLVGFIIISVFALALGITGFVYSQSVLSKSANLQGSYTHLSSFTEIINGHNDWRFNLARAILSNSEFAGPYDPTSCSLGKWMNGEEAKELQDPVIREHLARIVAPHNAMHNNASEVMALLQGGDSEGAIEMMNTTVIPNIDSVIGELTAISKQLTSMNNETETEIRGLTNTVMLAIGVLTFVILLICIFLSITITRSIVHDIEFFARLMSDLTTTGNFHISDNTIHEIEEFRHRKGVIGEISSSFGSLIEMMQRKLTTILDVADGNLATQVVHRSPEDSYGEAIQKMVDDLNEMFIDIHRSAELVSSDSKQISDGAQSLASGSTEQAASIQELSSSISEIADTIRSNAELADSATKLAQIIRDNAEKGSRQMDEMIGAVNEINEASGSISKVIKVIDDIAFQTNILALNAAVEAARAGQHGKGFAVVAEEVRNLAAKSAEAAKDTSGLIENSIEKATLGARIAGETATSLTEIVDGIKKSNQMIEDIARLSEGQSIAIGQINSGIDQVSQVIQQNSAMAEESSASAQELNGQAETLQHLVLRFKLHDSNTGTSQQQSQSQLQSHMRQTQTPQQSLPQPEPLPRPQERHNAGEYAQRRISLPEKGSSFAYRDIDSNNFGKY